MLSVLIATLAFWAAAASLGAWDRLGPVFPTGLVLLLFAAGLLTLFSTPFVLLVAMAAAKIGRAISRPRRPPSWRGLVRTAEPIPEVELLAAEGADRKTVISPRGVPDRWAVFVKVRPGNEWMRPYFRAGLLLTYLGGALGLAALIVGGHPAQRYTALLVGSILSFVAAFGVICVCVGQINRRRQVAPSEKHP